MKNYVAVNVNYSKKNEDHVYVLETDKKISEVDYDLFGSYPAIARFEKSLFNEELSAENFCTDDIDSFYEKFKISLYERVYNPEQIAEWCLEIKPLAALMDWFKGLNKRDAETQKSSLFDFQRFTSIQFVPVEYQSKELLMDYLKKEREQLLKKELSFYQPEEFWDQEWKDNIPHDFFDVTFRRHVLIQC